jgi:hypothetical protein
MHCGDVLHIERPESGDDAGEMISVRSFPHHCSVSLYVHGRRWPLRVSLDKLRGEKEGRGKMWRLVGGFRSESLALFPHHSHQDASPLHHFLPVVTLLPLVEASLLGLL